MAQLTGLDALRQLKKSVPNILFIYGEEYMLIDLIVKQVMQVSGVKDKNDFNYLSIDADNLEPSSVPQILQAPPMLVEKRVVLISNASELFKSNTLRQQFQEEIEKIPSTTVLILWSNNKPDRRQKIYRIINKVGLVIDCKPLSSNEIKQWLLRELKRSKKTISRDVLDHFIDLVGNSMQKLMFELQKVLAYTVNKQQISKEDIDYVVSPSIEAGIFSCVDALGLRNITKAYSELDLLLAAGEPPLRILIMIIRQIRLILKVKLIMDKNFNAYQRAKELGVPEFVAKKIYNQSANFTLEELKTFLCSLNILEEKIKTGQIEAKYGLELWMLQSGKAV